MYPLDFLSNRGLGVSREAPDVFATVRSTVAVFEPCVAGLVLEHEMEDKNTFGSLACFDMTQN